jgi:hypothetical protein
MAIDLDRALLLAAGAAMLLLAGVILAAGPGRALYRAFAALVALRGASTLLPQVSNDPVWRETALHVQPYFALALVPVAVYAIFALRDPDPDAHRPARHGWLAVGAIALLDGIYALRHELFQTLSAAPPANSALRAAEGLSYTDFGPLAAVASLTALLLALLGLRLALAYRERARTPQGTTLLLLTAGFLLGALFDGTSRLAALAALMDAPAGYPWLPWGWAVAILPVLALVPAALTVIVLAAGRTAEPRPQRPLEGRILLLSAFAASSGFLRLVGGGDADPAGQALVLVLLGLWRLAMPVLVTYALLLQAWRGVEGSAREGLAWAAAATLILLPGIAIAATARSVLPGPWAPLAGLVASTVLAAAVGRPVLAGGRRIAAWIIPGPRPIEPPRPAARSLSAR